MRVRLSVLFFYSIFFLCLIATRCIWAKWEGEPPLKMKYDEHEFLAACREGNVPAVEFYLRNKDFDPNKYFLSGATGKLIFGLFLAAQNGHDKVVEILAQTEGINVNQTYGNATPLFIASQNGDGKVVEILVDAGADPTLAWRYWGIFSKKPRSIAWHQRSTLRRVNPDRYDNYTKVIQTLKQAERAWKRVHPTRITSLFESINSSETAPLLPGMKRLSISPPK